VTERGQAPAQIAHYRVRRPIGGGAMADVYEAEDVHTGEVVALKVLQEHVGATREAVARFVREGRALQNLRHANIVRVLEQGVTDQGDAWIALERLRGASLDALIRDEVRLHPVRALYLVQDVAKALATVHARGLIHRDIKPENVFVVLPDSPHEHAKLIDFGIARVSQAELGENSIVYTRMSSMIGTAAFAAPEQMLGREVTPQADIFAVGVTAYEMLTGALPFEGETLQAQLKAKAVGRVVPLAARMRDPSAIDPAFAAVIMSCLSVDPGARPKDGLALVRELAACIERAGARPSLLDVAPRPASARAATGTGRSGARARLLAIAAVVLAAIAIALFALRR
jgi:serine/threonine-protein kinase